MRNSLKFWISGFFLVTAGIEAQDFEWWSSERVAKSQAVVETSRIFGNAQSTRQRAEAMGMIGLMKLHESEKERLAKLCKLPHKSKVVSRTKTRDLPGGGSEERTTSSGTIRDAAVIDTHESGRQLSLLLSSPDPANWTKRFLESLYEDAQSAGRFKSTAKERKARRLVDEVIAAECKKIRRARLVLVGWEVSSVSGIGISNAKGGEGRQAAALAAKKRAERALDFAVRGIIREWDPHAKTLGIRGQDRRALASAAFIAEATRAAALQPVVYRQGGGKVCVLVTTRGSDWTEKILAELEAKSLAHESAAGDKEAFRKAMAAFAKMEKNEAAHATKDVRDILKSIAN